MTVAHSYDGLPVKVSGSVAFEHITEQKEEMYYLGTLGLVCVLVLSLDFISALWPLKCYSLLLL